MTTHVTIATTQGPVFIQEITEEESGVSPMVCLNGTSKQLAISNAYADFVKKGSGLIERDFGFSSWRMDVSGAIDAGESWQLGVYMAHSLHQDNLLGHGDIKHGDEVMLVTGAVKYSGEVTPVGQIPDKMRAAMEQIKTWQAQGATVTLLMHPDNLTIAASAALSADNQRAISHVDELNGGKATGDKRSYAMPALVLVVAALIIVAATMLLNPEQKVAAPPDKTELKAGLGAGFEAGFEAKPDKQANGRNASAELEILSAAEPFLCQTDEMHRVTQAAAPDGYFKTTEMARLCGINLLTQTSGKIQASLYALDSGAMMPLLSVTDSGQAGWQIPLPGNKGNPRRYVVIVTNQRLSPKDQSELKSNLDGLRPFGTDPIQEVHTILNTMSLDAAVFAHSLR